MKKFKKISLIVVSLVVFAMSLFAEPPYKPAEGWVRGTYDCNVVFDEKYIGKPDAVADANSWEECQDIALEDEGGLSWAYDQDTGLCLVYYY